MWTWRSYLGRHKGPKVVPTNLWQLLSKIFQADGFLLILAIMQEHVPNERLVLGQF